MNISSDYDQAKIRVPELIEKFKNSTVPEYDEITTLLINWETEIINSFITYKGRRINSSIAESINSRVNVILYNSKGIRNTERRRKRIIYSINKEPFKY